jgi:predicted HicB family RNase H-like nuclease
MAGKFGDIIQKARQEEKTDDQLTTRSENQITSEPEVNLCVKVPKSLRQHWAAEAKRADITMTSVIIQALTQKFGLPDSQID